MLSSYLILQYIGQYNVLYWYIFRMKNLEIGLWFENMNMQYGRIYLLTLITWQHKLQVVRALEGDVSLADLNEGIRPGHSTMYSSHESSDYDTAQYKEDMKKFRKMALGTQEYGASSEYSAATSEYGLNPSGSSSEALSRQTTREMEMRKMKNSQGFSGSSWSLATISSFVFCINLYMLHFLPMSQLIALLTSLERLANYNDFFPFLHMIIFWIVFIRVYNKITQFDSFIFFFLLIQL